MLSAAQAENGAPQRPQRWGGVFSSSVETQSATNQLVFDIRPAAIQQNLASVKFAALRQQKHTSDDAYVDE